MQESPESKTLLTQLEQARTDLSDLESDIPGLEKLVSDNAQRVTDLRSRPKSADVLGELSAAQGRAQAAQTLLEDHKAEVEAVRGEVAKLETAHTRATGEEKLAQLEREYTATHSELEKLRLKAVADLERSLKALSALQARRYAGLLEAQTVLQTLESYGEHLATFTGLHQNQMWQRGNLDAEIVARRGEFAQALLNPHFQDVQHPFHSEPWYALNALQQKK